MTPQTKPVDLTTLLEKIEKIGKTQPQVGEQLLAEFREFSKHFREMDAKALRAQIRVTYIGQACGLVIGLTAIVSGAIVSVQGSEWAGGFIGGGGVIGLVSVFVLGRRAKS